MGECQHDYDLKQVCGGVVPKWGAHSIGQCAYGHFKCCVCPVVSHIVPYSPLPHIYDWWPWDVNYITETKEEKCFVYMCAYLCMSVYV